MTDTSHREEHDRRRLTFMESLQLLTALLMVAAIVYRGGQISNQLETIVITVNRIDMQQKAASEEQARASAELRVHGQRLDDHDRRINQIERQRR